MNPLIYAVIGLAVLALGATLYALFTAREGYEDDAGFHPTESDQRHRNGLGGPPTKPKSPLRALLNLQ
ncbi:MAG: hypothetical protein IT162_06660 [Bryobacterales bacterium]|nr:hypothetical protein [Bryobacterales bacterium]